MFLLEDRLVHSASDLALASQCEFALLRNLDARLGRIETTRDEDPMFARAAALGGKHEREQLARFRQRFGDGVVEIERPARIPSELRSAAEATAAAARDRVPVIYQGTFYTGDFLGFGDFLVFDPVTESYEVHDTKLSRTERVTSLLQLAAYSDALSSAGIPVSDTGCVILGDGTSVPTHLPDVLPVFRRARTEMVALLQSHLEQLLPAAWSDDIRACHRCDDCLPEVHARRDLLIVAGMRGTTRATLHDAGIVTIDELAASAEPVPGLSVRMSTALRAQARAQVEQESTGTPMVEVHTPEALGALPTPNDGDIFFDFEGDPLYMEAGWKDWGLEYLFGIVEHGVGGATVFRPFWAHTRAEEKAAFVAFMDYLADRRRSYPGMCVYHYAAYEKSALLRLAARHGVYENEVDDLLRGHVLVDLYPIVKSALRIGAQSYSIKKLEPFYMDGVRDGVTNAADSIVEYARWCELRDRGDTDSAAEVLAEIAEYNEYDCVSTLRLRDWLLGFADDAAVPRRAIVDDASAETESGPDDENAELRKALYAHAGEPGLRDPDRQAAAMVAAALGYHQREEKPYWWAHFDRLSSPVDEWADTRDVFVVESTLEWTDWVKKNARSNARRTLVLAGEFGPGSTPSVGSSVHVLYAPPAPEWVKDSDKTNPQNRWTTKAKILDIAPDGATVTLEEMLATGADEHVLEPVATAPDDNVRTETLRTAIAEQARDVVGSLPELPRTAVLDLLRRAAPRTRSGGGLRAVVGDDHVGAITASLLDLDRSYLAVQGPPGTGKTYTGSHVIATLVRDHGWRIGVVGQSHAVVENLLDGVVKAGLDPARIGKKTTKSAAHAYQDTTSVVGFLGAHPEGCVIGGTAWAFCGRDAPAEPLDLLVIDEAGQFSLGNTLAVAGATNNVLLLGDPQQLPQVSQGSHPEPVDTSALGWLADGRGTLPTELGYFLATTRRMNSALCEPVSTLSYDGRLHAHPSVNSRSLEGVPPGVHTVLVPHEGNATSSPEEAAAVVDLIRSLVGSTWTDGDATRPLTAADVLVVAAYNAHVHEVRIALDAAGMTDTACGTVDKFQGREAAIVIVSMAASAPEEVPRGMEFLLSRNRINVALSRGQWAAYVVRSPALTHYLPSSPVELGLLGAFMRVSPDEPS